MQTLTATNARNNFFPLLKNTLEGSLLTKIKHKSGNAVLLSETDYEELIETAELSLIPGLKDSLNEAAEDINNGDLYTLDEAFSS